MHFPDSFHWLFFGLVVICFTHVPASALLDVSYYPSYDDDGLHNAIEGDIPQGYRFTSLSAFGEWPNVRYAALEVKRPGPAQEFIHGATIAEFDA